MRSQHPIAVLYGPLVLEHNHRPTTVFRVVVVLEHNHRPTAVFRVVVVLEHNRRTRGGVGMRLMGWVCILTL